MQVVTQANDDSQAVFCRALKSPEFLEDKDSYSVSCCSTEPTPSQLRQLVELKEEPGTLGCRHAWRVFLSSTSADEFLFFAWLPSREYQRGQGSILVKNHMVTLGPVSSPGADS